MLLSKSCGIGTLLMPAGQADVFGQYPLLSPAHFVQKLSQSPIPLFCPPPAPDPEPPTRLGILISQEIPKQMAFLNTTCSIVQKIVRINTRTNIPTIAAWILFLALSKASFSPFDVIQSIPPRRPTNKAVIPAIIKISRIRKVKTGPNSNTGKPTVGIVTVWVD